MERRAYQLMIVIAAALALAACAQPEKDTAEGDAAEVVDQSTGATTDDSASTQGVTGGTGFAGSPLDDPENPLYQRIVYFDFDSSEISGEDRSIIEAHSQWLAEHPGATVTLEGHADERGTREYNIGLGDRRSNTVRQLMALLGASGSQLRMISYGEERPAVEGHDESAWRFNRRVEIIYRSRE